jgi:putative ABC transport system substrate-binding protein
MPVFGPGQAMRRRDFIKGVAGSAITWPLAARAQEPRIPVIGFLHAGSADGYAEEVAGFRQGLREAGYIEGQNAAIEYRWADGQYDRLSVLAADLVRKRVAVIAAAPVSSAIAAKQATPIIPIVFELGADPVRTGLVASLNRPGGNITGVVNLSNTLVTKRIEIMHQVVPSATSIALLVDPGVETSEAVVGDAKKAETLLGIRIEVLKASALNEIEAAFARVVEIQAGALVVGIGPVFTSYAQQIGELASRSRVPASHADREFARAGGLFSYGADLPDAYRLTGVYAARILHGDKPAELPVQQAAKIEMVINLKTAKKLGITFPLTSRHLDRMAHGLRLSDAPLPLPLPSIGTSWSWGRFA